MKHLVVLLNLLTILTATRSIADAPSAATWSLAGSMHTARFDQTATLLPNGMVLVVGGASMSISTPYHVLASTELYDPRTGIWSLTGRLHTARASHIAILLHSGKVLVAGGEGPSGAALTSAELYDPRSGTWTETGHMIYARDRHTATLLPDGRVLVAGGSAQNSRSAELYDPSTGTWSVTGQMKLGRYAHEAVLLASGKVLVVGGLHTSSIDILAGAEIYDPHTGTWAATGTMLNPRDYFTATLLHDGTVLVAGAAYTKRPRACRLIGTVCPPYSDAELYNPHTGTWTSTGRMRLSRVAHTATLLTNGTVLVAGGSGLCNNSSKEPCSSLADAEIYTPHTGSWIPTGALHAGRASASATLLSNGTVLVTGGIDGRSSLATTELYGGTKQP